MKRESYGKIVSVNLKYNLRLPLASALGVFVLTLLVFNITALQSREAARPIELLLCFTGVMLFVPVFYPEQNEDIRDVIRSKKIDHMVICMIRIAYSVVIMAGLIAFFVLIMKMHESNVGAEHFISGLASAWFLGAVGFAAAGMTNNVTVGYMAAMLYYLVNYGLKDKLGVFFLFSMSYSGKSDTAGYMVVGAAVLMGITLFLNKNRR